MGTYYRVSYFSEDVSYPSKEIHKAIQSDLAEVNRQMSTYIEILRYQLSIKLEAQISLPISPWFAHVLKYSLELAKESDGIFDPTVGPLVNLWGFGPDGPKQHPSSTQIEKTLTFIGYDLLELKSSTVLKKKKASYIDLSSVAKGYAVEYSFENL